MKREYYSLRIVDILLTEKIFVGQNDLKSREVIDLKMNNNFFFHKVDTYFMFIEKI